MTISDTEALYTVIDNFLGSQWTKITYFHVSDWARFIPARVAPDAEVTNQMVEDMNPEERVIDYVKNVAEYINDSAITGFIVNVANDQKWVLKYCNMLLNMQLELMGIDEALNVYFSYSRDDVLRYIMELSAEGDEIYKNYLSNFEEEQPVGERISSENGNEI